MIDYFAAAETTLRHRPTLDVSLEVLRARLDAAIRRAAPAGYPTASFRDDVGYSGTRSTNDALTEVLELAEIQREILDTETERDLIDKALDLLDEADRTILQLWYIERVGKDDIAERMNYESRTTIYQMRNKAVYEFAIRYFGAGAVKA